MDFRFRFCNSLAWISTSLSGIYLSVKYLIHLPQSIWLEAKFHWSLPPVWCFYVINTDGLWNVFTCVYSISLFVSWKESNQIQIQWSFRVTWLERLELMFWINLFEWGKEVEYWITLIPRNNLEFLPPVWMGN